MAEKTTEKKPEKEMTRDEYFDQEIKNVKSAQVTAGAKGWLIILTIMIFEYLFIPNWGIWRSLVEILTFATVFFFVMYFVWGPQDIFWASFPREGYVKGVLLGNHIRRFIGCPYGKAFNKDYDLINEDHPDATDSRDPAILGMHIIWEWPFGKIYQEKTEWERWYPNLKKPLPRRELLREFTLLPYPYYVEIVDAEDFNRLGVTIYTNVVMHIVNPKKALFRQATTWIDLVKPLIQGGYVSYIKSTTLQEMLGKGVKDLGADLLKNMPSPNSDYTFLKDLIERVYGVKIESISVLDIVGADEAEKVAINARAIARLNRDAALINADAKAQAGAIDTIGRVIKMLAQLISETMSIENDQDRQKALEKAENDLKSLLRDKPEEFQKLYGHQFEVCVDFVQRQMALEKGKFVDVRTPDAKGSTGDLLSMIMATKLVDAGGSGSKSSSNEEKEKKGKEDLPFPGYELK